MCNAFTWDLHSSNDDRFRKANCKFTTLIILSLAVNVVLLVGIALFLGYLYYVLVIPGECTEIYRIVTNALRNRRAPPAN